MRRILVAALILSLVPVSFFAGDEEDWASIEADYSWLQTLRNANHVPGPDASRKERIEAWLANERKIEPVYGRFIERLEDYYRRTGDERAASLFISEKIRIGDGYMEILSRYDRAANVYRGVLEIDPDHQEALRKLEIAESRRFVDAARFAQIEDGLSEAEVERILGLPREDWIRQKIEPGHVYSVWIYPRSDGGAAAVYFDGGVVYHQDWDASPAPRPVEEKAGGR